MKARMQLVLGVCGMVFALGIGVFGTGCSANAKGKLRFKNRHHSLSVDLSSGVMQYEYQKLFTVAQQLNFDLDSKSYIPFVLNNKEYNYYAESDCLFVEETNELIIRDNPSWDSFFENESNLLKLTHQSNYVFTTLQGREVKGTYLQSVDLSTVFQNEILEVTISLHGGAPIPDWDVERWPSLERKLFLFPDGIVGSPDPISVRLHGEASDVFGYLYEIGIGEGSFSVDDNDWVVQFDDNGLWADVFVNDVLFRSVLMH
jgi:hypothetical protein